VKVAKSDKVSSIDEIKYLTKTGVVLDGQNSTTTHVHGGGGQNNSAVRISSSTTKHLHLFVRQDNGKEFDTTFDNIGVSVRAGHRVSVVYAGPKAREIGYSTGLVVHDTDRSAVCNATADSLVKRMNPLLGVAIFFVAPFVILGILLLLTGNRDAGGFYWVLGVIIVSIYLFARLKRSNSVTHAIVSGVESEIHKAIEQEKSRASAA
jgi:hypothetical protein